MGRKIPGKKHRKVKDPYKQQQQRLDRLSINNPPSNSNEQEIPKSLLRIIELKNKVKQKITKKPVRKTKGPEGERNERLGKGKQPLRKSEGPSRKNKESVLLSLEKFLDNDPSPKGATKPDKFIPNLVQRPNESAKSFLARVSSMTKSLINEVEFEKKFGIEIKKDQKTGEVVEIKNVKKQNIKSKKKKLREKRKEKLKQKKENLRNVKDFSQLKDRVEFGEVVHRPPDLTAIKNKNPSQKHKYDNLLLNNIVKEVSGNTTSLASNLQKEKAENERKFIVEAYRKVKNYKRV